MKTFKIAAAAAIAALTLISVAEVALAEGSQMDPNGARFVMAPNGSLAWLLAAYEGMDVGAGVDPNG
jgi:hypothetical protein